MNEWSVGREYEFVFFVKQKTAYKMRINDCSSDVCSSDRLDLLRHLPVPRQDVVARRVAGIEQHIDALLDDHLGDRKRVVSGKSVSVRVYLGCRRTIQKKKLLPHKHVPPNHNNNHI